MASAKIIPMPHTLLLIAVPEADTLLEALRQAGGDVRPDELTVDAHITLLAPFAPSHELTGALLRELREFFAEVRPFRFELAELDSFSEELAFLRPEPVEPFLELTSTLSSMYPQYPPYNGLYESVTPHLTIAWELTSESFAALGRLVDPYLPVRTEAKQAHLVLSDESLPFDQPRGTTLARFPFA